MASFIVNTGLAIMAARMKGVRADTTVQPEPVFVAWGTGAGTAAKPDTTLFTEAANSTGNRVSATTSIVTTTVANDTYQQTATLTNNPAGSAMTVTNGGSFDANTTGNLFIKGNFTGVALNPGDSILFTFQMICTSS